MKKAPITFSVKDVMKAMDSVKCGRILVNNYPMNVTQTLRTFKNKGTKCDVCGIEGEFFELKVDTSSNSLSLELVAQRGDRRVKMTRDHTVARHLGGKDNISNVVTMCSVCNNEWKNEFDRKNGNKIFAVSDEGSEFLMLCT